MSSIKIKSFLGPKGGVDYHDGEDRFALNVELGRFAVADGVSQSYLPNLWAEILCEAFVKSHAKADENWIEQYAVCQMASDCHYWGQQSEAFLNNGSEDENFWLKIKRDKYHYAGSTLVGIAIKEKSLYFNVLGDSCLFLFNQETRKLNSYSTVNEQEGFTNHPDFLWSAGDVVGKSKYGQLPLAPGYVLLATDKISEWIIRRYARDSHLIERLWSLDSHEAFMSLVEESRSDNSMDDDDVALMIFRIESDVAEGFEVLFCDEMVSLVGQETKTLPLEPTPSEHTEDDSEIDTDETVREDLTNSESVTENNILEQEANEKEHSSPEINEIGQEERFNDNQPQEASSLEGNIIDSDMQNSPRISNNDNNTVVGALRVKSDEPAVESDFELDENKSRRELSCESEIENTKVPTASQCGPGTNASIQVRKNTSFYKTNCVKIRWMLRKFRCFFCAKTKLNTVNKEQSNNNI